MVVKGESPRSGAKMPYANSYGGGGAFFNCGAGEGTSGASQVGAVVFARAPSRASPHPPWNAVKCGSGLAREER
ncbi:hypothetical protein EAH78_14815 [Pseudomonas arsenicoxydans]|uniref:Uncharacterized protein n=1 Tax=Pseudomonas arsenicoxydans TaxID=702115 RepID=A0A502HWG5_9PSED|nr:hypothetical protein EAH78_14815 [Pseudomonas arsenicoxydans]